jgi:hypothetical protein
MRYGRTIEQLILARRAGKLKESFTPKEANSALGINFGGTFLPKHCVGNPGGNTPLFIRIAPGRYSFNKEHLSTLGLYLS